MADSLQDRLYQIIEKPWSALLILGVFSLWAASAIVSKGILEIDNSVSVWFPAEHPKALEYAQFQAEFGNDELIMVATECADPILSEKGLGCIATVQHVLETVDGIEEVYSITSASVLDATEGMTEGIVGIDSAIQTTSTTELATQPSVSFFLGSNDHVSVVIAKLEMVDNIDQQRDIIFADVQRAFTDANINTDASSTHVHYGGIGVIYSALNRASTIDSAPVMAGSYIVIVGLLWLLLGNIRSTVMMLGSIGISVFWLIGAFLALDYKVNMVTMVVPTLSLVIGLSSGIHMSMRMAQYSSVQERLLLGMRSVFVPCLINAITTAIGFLSLLSSSMPVVQQLGMLGALGVIFSFVSGYCVLVLLGRYEWWVPTQAITQEKQTEKTWLKTVAWWSIDHHRWILGGTGLAFVLALLGIAKVETDTYSLGFLPPDHTARVDSDWIEREYGFYTPMEFVLRVPNEQFAQTLLELQQWQQDVALDGFSMYSVLQPIQQAYTVFAPHENTKGLRENQPLPADISPDSVEQLLLLCQLQEDLSSRLIRDQEQTSVRVQIRSAMTSAQGFAKNIDKVKQRAHFSPQVQIEATGYMPLYVEMMEVIVQSQVWSFSLAFVFTLCALWLVFRDWRLVLISIPGNLLPIVIILGTMGWMGISLDVATVTISAIVFGLVVDDTIQFIYRLQAERQKLGLDWKELHYDDIVNIGENTIIHVGKPMVSTSLILAVGFSILGFAPVVSVQYFGLLLGLALVVALVGDLLVLPAILYATFHGVHGYGIRGEKTGG